MPRNVVRADGRRIENDLQPVAPNPDIAARLQSENFVVGRRIDREAQRARTGAELRWRQSDPENRVVEERDVPVRMAHRGEPREHPAGDVGPALENPGREDRRKNPAHREQIENVAEDDRVIHRAAFEMSAVRENLLGELALENPEAKVEPFSGFVAFEKQPGEHQRLGVGEEMVSEEVVLEPPAQVARLDREAVHGSVGQREPRPLPFDPVDDPQRQWIGLPACAEARRILGDPPGNEPLVPRSSTSPSRRIEVVEVMQVVEPQPVRAGIVPVRGVGQRPLDIQEPKNVLFNQAPFTQRRQGKDR